MPGWTCAINVNSAAFLRHECGCWAARVAFGISRSRHSMCECWLCEAGSQLIGIYGECLMDAVYATCHRYQSSSSTAPHPRRTLHSP